MRKKALYILSENDKVSNSEEYELYEDHYIIDNYGEKLELTKDEIRYLFYEVK